MGKKERKGRIKRAAEAARDWSISIQGRRFFSLRPIAFVGQWGKKEQEGN